MSTIAEQLRALAAQLDQPANSSTAQRRELLPHSDNPRAAMKLARIGTTNDAVFLEPFFMEGYVGAAAGVRLSTWNAEQFFAVTHRNEGWVPHYEVLMPNAGQRTVSPVDIGWMEPIPFDPDDYPDDTDCIRAYRAAACPTVGPRGEFGHLGRYMKAGDGHAIAG